jgi:hypothetical protein
VLDDKAAGKQRIFIEAVQEGVTEHIGDLQSAPSIIEKIKKIATLVFKQRKAFRPSISVQL